jgi:hypothetical protein
MDPLDEQFHQLPLYRPGQVFVQLPVQLSKQLLG